MTPRLLTERPVRLRGSVLARTALRLLGWRLEFDGLPAKQGVAIVYPHTSNWDFVIGILAKWAMGLQVTFWGKDTLFRVPLLGRWMRWLGGMPVDRHNARGVVGQMAAELRAAREADRFLWLVLAPEGTRQYATGWRSGFYHVTLEAGVPLGLAFIDWRTRSIGIPQFLQPAGDAEADFAAIAQALGHRVGKRPALAAPIRLNRPST